MIESVETWRWLLYVLLGAAALSDIRSLRIPNYFPLGVVAALVVALVAASAAPEAYAQAAGSALIGLAVGYAVFALKLMGGGDGKLFAAAAAWFQPSALLAVGFWVSLSGIGLALAALAARALRAQAKSAPDVAATPALKTPIPYGVAIAVGALIAAEIGR